MPEEEPESLPELDPPAPNPTDPSPLPLPLPLLPLLPLDSPGLAVAKARATSMMVKNSNTFMMGTRGKPPVLSMSRELRFIQLGWMA